MKTVRRTGSIHALVRRLLTSLEDPAALRRNPLVSFLIAREPEKSPEICTLVRSCVLRVIDEMVARASPRFRRIAERRRHILLYYDIEGQDRSVVASTLGITERQLYRERRIACEQLASALSSLNSAARIGDQILTVHEETIPISTALTLAAAGRHQSAIAFLLATVSFAADEAQKLTALFGAAQLHYDLCEFASGDRLTAECHRLLRRADLAPHRRADLAALLGFARGRQLWRRDEVTEAVRTLERSVVHFSYSRGDRPMIHHPGEAYLITRELINIGDLARETGDISRWNAMFFEARRIMDALHDVPPYLRVEWLTNLAVAQMLNLEPFGDIAADLGRAVALCERHGYPSLAAHATAAHACLAHRQDDVAARQAFKQAALRYARMIETAQVRGEIAVVLTFIEPDPRAAASLARYASESLSQDYCDRSWAWLAAGQAYLKSGNLSEARSYAERILAMPGLERTQSSVYGRTLMLMAELEFRAGKAPAAKRQIEQALGVVQEHAPREMLILATKMWTELTGKSPGRRFRSGEPSQFFRS